MTLSHRMVLPLLEVVLVSQISRRLLRVILPQVLPENQEQIEVLLEQGLLHLVASLEVRKLEVEKLQDDLYIN